MPSVRPRIRIARRCGPVRPSMAAILFEDRWRPWSTAHISLMKLSTLPRPELASEAGRNAIGTNETTGAAQRQLPRRRYYELKRLDDMLELTRVLVKEVPPRWPGFQSRASLP